MNNLFVACGLSSHWLRRNEWGSRGLADSLVGFTVFGAVFLVADRFWPAKMGGGDIKMMSGIGAWLGLETAFFALTIAFTCGALLGIAGLALGKARSKTQFPFGPFLAFGSLMAVLCPRGLLGWTA
jgi:prepilin signal peptidase PulO-like enzyme (type II secretory pathway)